MFVIFQQWGHVAAFVHVLSFNSLSPSLPSPPTEKKNHVYSSDAPLDLKIKASMVADMFSLVGECNAETVTPHNVHLIAEFLQQESRSGGITFF